MSLSMTKKEKEFQIEKMFLENLIKKNEYFIK